MRFFVTARHVSSALVCSLCIACGGAPKPVKKVVEKPLEDPRAPGVPTPAIDQFEAGVKAMQAKPAQYNKAVDAFKQALALHGDYILAQMNLAIAYEKLGRYEDAADTYQELIARRVIDEGVQLALGRALMLSGKVSEAIEKFKDILKASGGKNLKAQNNLAAAYLKTGELDVSLDFVKDVLAVQPKNVPAIINLGLIYLRQQKLPLALLMFKKALGYDKENPRAQNNLGLTYYAMSIKDRNADTLPNAVIAFEKAINLDPTMDEARLNIGSVFLDYLDYKRALEQFQAVRKRFPKHYQAMIGEANSLYGVGEYDKAMALYQETLAMDEGKANGEAILRVGKIFEQQLNKPNKALEYYKKYVSIVNPPKEAKIRQTIMFLEQAEKLKLQPEQGGAADPNAAQPASNDEAAPAEPNNDAAAPAEKTDAPASTEEGEKPEAGAES
ncbi:MAG: tetratricopeptide repeat protein [Bradymonadia bacterium]